MTAIERASSTRRTAFAAAIRSRSSYWPAVSSVTVVGNSTSTYPGRVRIESGKPVPRKTSIMRWFSGSTSAWKNSMPWAAAASARCSMRIDARPCPCSSSDTDIAISARALPSRTYWAPPTTSVRSGPAKPSTVRWST